MTFSAYEGGRVTHIKRFTNSSTLITIGVTFPNSNARLRVGYAVDRRGAEDLAFR